VRKRTRPARCVVASRPGSCRLATKIVTADPARGPTDELCWRRFQANRQRTALPSQKVAAEPSQQSAARQRKRLSCNGGRFVVPRVQRTVRTGIGGVPLGAPRRRRRDRHSSSLVLRLPLIRALRAPARLRRFLSGCLERGGGCHFRKAPLAAANACARAQPDAREGMFERGMEKAPDSSHPQGVNNMWNRGLAPGRATVAAGQHCEMVSMLAPSY